MVCSPSAEMEKIKFQHIMSICGIFRQPLGVVMEFMASGSLEKMLSTHSLGWQLKVCTIHETSLAMNFLHSIKLLLLHLDLKPGNILLDSYMHVKVSDFGLSKRMEQWTQMQCIKRSALQGTLSYIPLRCSWRVTRIQGPNTTCTGCTCPVCSFGIVIWEILTQKKPYSGSSSHDSERKGKLQPRPCFLPLIFCLKIFFPVSPTPSPARMSDIIAETDMLLWLLQSPVAHHEREALAGKLSCAACRPGEVFCDSWADSESLVPSDEQECIYENKLTPPFTSGLLLAQEVDVDCQQPAATRPSSSLLQISRLLEHRADANLADEDGWAPLHFAAQNGDNSSTHLLLDQGARVDAQEHEGWTPLHLAAQNNSEDVARLLVSHQDDPNLREAEGKTPLHVVAYFGHISLQRNLRMPLHLAVEGGKGRAIQHLLKSGVAPDTLDQSSYSPLHTATARGKYLIYKMMLRYEASLELPTQQVWTPLHLAAYKGHLEIIHLLAESQADVVVSTLLKCGADSNAAEQSGWTPLHLAVQRGRPFLSIIHLLEHHADGNMAILRVPVKAGAQLDIQEGVGCTPLQLALWSQKQGIIAFPEGREPSLAILGGTELGAQMEV
ncbi:hypothetical protein FD755_017527 [Muntiacus reevesi]|uniref:Protein kinase domain-containing protein n=1 Tax=Muntiacus reevesi TaxID=9886 RepID=A0A5N3XFB5_MUNRE|nr:hypothetical protein FD755_017527 [Muntiacus reevesi]